MNSHLTKTNCKHTECFYNKLGTCEIDVPEYRNVDEPCQYYVVEEDKK